MWFPPFRPKSRPFPIAPIPCSERLPDIEDSDSSGLCWWWRTDKENCECCWETLVWDFDVIHYNYVDGNRMYTHWLPYWAIPDLNPQ